MSLASHILRPTYLSVHRLTVNSDSSISNLTSLLAKQHSSPQTTLKTVLRNSPAVCRANNDISLCKRLQRWSLVVLDCTNKRVQLFLDAVPCCHHKRRMDVCWLTRDVFIHLAWLIKLHRQQWYRNRNTTAWHFAWTNDCASTVRCPKYWHV